MIPLLSIITFFTLLITLNHMQWWRLLWCRIGHHPLTIQNARMDPKEEEEIGWRIGLDTCACRKRKHYWISD